MTAQITIAGAHIDGLARGSALVGKGDRVNRLEAPCHVR
jgi:hypothetical protein